MNVKDRLIIEEYRKRRNDYVELEAAVYERLQKMVDDAGLMIMGIEHRLKTESSLAGKLLRYGDKFQIFDDLLDLLGTRVICFFADEVDEVGKMVEQVFAVDWEHSSDKRALLKADTFGYLSLHYICYLPSGAGWPDRICGLKFEIQIRTVLQHAWAAIEHDLGYKSQFGVPRAIRREFSRVAGLLELADEEFVRVRDGMGSYTGEIREKIINNQAEDVPLDMVSLREYMLRNKKMQAFLEELAATAGAEVAETDPESYLMQLEWLGKKTVGDLQQMLEDGRETALNMVRRILAATDLDIVSSNAALRFLCHAELLNGGYTLDQAAEFMALTVSDKGRARRQAERLFRR